MKTLHTVSGLLLAVLLAACGGGSSDNGGNNSATCTIGGTVIGLSGTLVLRNNGGDDCTITGNGSFTFASAVANGGTYAVTVRDEPSNQNCRVTNGTGTATANVTDVAVSCGDKAWTVPASLSDNISPDGPGVSAFPAVATDGNGDAVIAWKQYDGTNYRVFKSEYRNGTWTHPASLGDGISPAGQDADFPLVAMNASGAAVIVWRQNDGTNYQIFKSEYRNGVWTHPASLTDNISPDGQNASSYRVAMDGSGNAVIVWVQSDGSDNQIFKSEYRNGAWTHPASLTDNISPDGQPAVQPAVAMNDQGNAIIAWRQMDGSYDQIFKSEYRNNAWTHPASLTDNISPDGQAASSPEVAMDGNGSAIIVWHQTDGTNYQIFKSEYRNNAWVHPASLTDNISPDGGDASLAQVAMDNNGNAIITWNQRYNYIYQIYKSEYRNNAWSYPASITDFICPGGQDAYEPKVVMNDNGKVIIAWYQSDGLNDQVFKSEYRNGAWTHPASLTDNISPDGQDAYAVRVAMDQDDNVVIVWLQNDGADYQVFKSEYR